MSNEEDVPQLSAETLKALQEFLQEQALQQDENNVTENWQLSQFWYDEDTTTILCKAILSLCNHSSNVGLISCPTLYPNLKSNVEQNNKNIKIVLYEYDKRFSKYRSDYVYYDYNNPLDIDLNFKNSFDVVIADPPFLSEECLTKVVQTIEFIRKADSKVIICTGAVMEDLAVKLLNVKKCIFQPKHKNNLANEFICLTNFGEITN